MPIWHKLTYLFIESSINAYMVLYTYTQANAGRWMHYETHNSESGAPQCELNRRGLYKILDYVRYPTTSVLPTR